MRITLEEMEMVATFLADEVDRFADHCDREGLGDREAHILVERMNADFREALDMAFNAELEGQQDVGRIRNN